MSCTSYLSVRYQGPCIGSHFKLINVVPANIHTFPTEEISAVHGGGGLKGRGGNFVDETLTN